MSPRLFALLLMVVAVLASAVAVVYSRHLHRQAYIALSTLEHERDELNIEFGRLQLEQATWSEANRIEQVAGTRIGMKYPAETDIVVLRP
ncbi:cell division protein FtsL [Arenimonas sp.]|uniref:cell division protein FtsL n=1 Tax=Arenimonas sp. TaxID=1872635 RepID=UPI0025C34AD2|nr:cell division protein FtsL [Arenimonas sp.]